MLELTYLPFKNYDQKYFLLVICHVSKNSSEYIFLGNYEEEYKKGKNFKINK